MPRTARIAPAGFVFHALNRGVDRKTLFHDEADYRAFEDILKNATARIGTRVCSYCLMPNHWHLVLWPSRDGELSYFMHRITATHAVRWKRHNNSVGHGHLYQNRFKSFPIQSDQHYLTVVRYVERNALRANLVSRAEEWRFSSLWLRRNCRNAGNSLLSAGPVELPDDWVERLNAPETSAELETLRESVRRGTPFGTKHWQKEAVRELNLKSSLRPRGRPKKSAH